jgi:hypothetical protein
MTPGAPSIPESDPRRNRLGIPSLVLALVVSACAGPSQQAAGPTPAPGALAATASEPAPGPDSDPRVDLGAGLFDAEEAIWNMRLLSATPPPEPFVGATNSDLAFTGPYAIQGNYRGFQVWDISDPASPELVTAFVCPASQSDVSVYRNLLFVSGEGLEGRLDCGTEGVQEVASPDRLRGIRIFDISDIRNPEYIANVQTCRGSHTHTVLKDPSDDEHVYVYVSGSAPVRPAEELTGCSAAPPDEDPNTALFRIEVIRVPLANPEEATIVSSPRIFEDLEAPPVHGPSPLDVEALAEARARGAFVVEIPAIGETFILPDEAVAGMLAEIVQARGGRGAPSAADSTTLRERLPDMMAQMMADAGFDPDAGPTQCHDITVYPALGLAGGACEGYGLLLDIRDPVNPRRIAAVADENFAYWHSATFNNAGTTLLFTDEWGGGGSPRCRDGDPVEWGANAIFTIENGDLVFQSYYKLPAPQSEQENCVAHNGSLIPVPGRDIKVQSWYQGGISVFDFTDPANPFEIAYHDRGPVHPERMVMAGSWSAYWYNGFIVSSEIARGLDILEMTPSPFLSQSEIDAANTVRLDYLNVQGQPQFHWPPSFALARAYLDQLERSEGLNASRIAAVREELAEAEADSSRTRATRLQRLASELDEESARSSDADRVRALVKALRALGEG